MALRVGRPGRVYPTGRRLTARLVARSNPWRSRTGHPHALALSLLADGIVATTPRRVAERPAAVGTRARGSCRDRCVGLTWETNTAQNLVIWALMYLGELGEVSRRVPALLADARCRGNLYLATELTSRAATTSGSSETTPMAANAKRWRASHAGRSEGFHRQHYSAPAGPRPDRSLSRRRRGRLAAAGRLRRDTAPFVVDLGAGDSRRVLLPARSRRTGHGRDRTRQRALHRQCPA